MVFLRQLRLLEAPLQPINTHLRVARGRAPGKPEGLQSILVSIVQTAPAALALGTDVIYEELIHPDRRPRELSKPITQDILD